MISNVSISVFNMHCCYFKISSMLYKVKEESVVVSIIQSESRHMYIVIIYSSHPGPAYR